MQLTNFHRFGAIFFILFLHLGFSVWGQEITLDNYADQFQQARKYISEEKYELGTQLQFNLVRFLDENREVFGDSLDIWYTKNYYNLCNIYLFQEFEKSVRYADSAIASALRTKDAGLKQRAFSIKYYCLYDVEGYEQELDFLADECIKYSEEANNDEMLAESLMHKCNAQVVLGSGERSFQYCERAESIFNRIMDEKYLSSVYNNIGNVYIKGGFIDKALEVYYKSHEYSVKHSDARSIAMSARNIAEKNETLGNYELSAEYYKVFGDSIESHLSKLISTNFSEAEAKYETQRKDKEIAEQQLEIEKQQNTRNLWIGGSLIAFLGGFIFFQRRNANQKRKKLQAETELQKEQEINELRTKFLGNIAHEIRTPLTLITGNLNLALEHFEDSNKAQSNIKTALSNSKRIADDANEILELLKFEKRKTTLKKTIIPLDATLKRMVFAFKSLAEMKHIDINVNSSIPDDYHVETDVEKIEKIVNNLMSNAIKYSPSGKEVVVNMRLQDEHLQMEVVDFGEGIHYDETEKIFERFYQSGQSNAIGGIGIGLSLSRELANLLGGTLYVESEKGEGSTFILKLPAPQTMAITSTEDSKKTLPSTKDLVQDDEKVLPATRQKVLIVEDNPEMCAYLEEILSTSYDCSVVFDGVEALEKIQSTNFDLITSDIMMPRMDGFELRERLNEDTRFRNIPFILISAKTLEEDKIKGFKLGIDDYIVKPFNKNELIARIDSLLANKVARETWKLENEELLSSEESSDQKLLKKIQTIILENLEDENYKIAQLAEAIGYSQRQLTRIMKQYTGMTPVQFILEIRLQKAYQCLQQKAFFTLSEVRYHVGINSSSYFNKKFKERFGLMPSELLS